MTMLRTGKGSALLAVVTTLALSLATGAQAAQPATAAKTTKCDISKVATKLGPTQVTSLTVSKTTCKNGIAIVKAYHACRTAHGVSGRCVKKVKGYACRETRTTGPTEFSAKVVCVKGKATVKHSYRQTLS
jgi:hypothetical protein